jgi:excisionase family DNA binding protein
MADKERNLRSGDVAEALGLAASTVQAYARKGQIPYRLTPGRHYRFNLEEVLALLAPSAVDVVADLPDIFTTAGPLVDELSGFRSTSPSDSAMRAARIRGVRDRGKQPVPAAGRDELDELVGHSSGFAAAVLRRDDALV